MVTHKIIFFSIILSSSLQCSERQTLIPTHASPQTIELAWDVHDVLVTKSIIGMVKIAVRDGHLKMAHLVGLFCLDCIRYPLSRTKGKALTLAQGIYTKIMDKRGLTMQEYRPTIEAYDPTLWGIARRMAGEFYPIAGMQELLNELNKLGYTQRYATNMSDLQYKDLCAKHPELFQHLTSGSTVDGDVENPIRKPSLDYFTEHQQRHNPDARKTIIFFDDNKKNIDAAQQAGMIGIHVKNAQQVRQELKALGIPLS